jgi:hypothetical protein
MDSESLLKIVTQLSKRGGSDRELPLTITISIKSIDKYTYGLSRLNPDECKPEVYEKFNGRVDSSRLTLSGEVVYPREFSTIPTNIEFWTIPEKIWSSDEENKDSLGIGIYDPNCEICKGFSFSVNTNSATSIRNILHHLGTTIKSGYGRFKSYDIHEGSTVELTLDADNHMSDDKKIFFCIKYLSFE